MTESPPETQNTSPTPEGERVGEHPLVLPLDLAMIRWSVVCQSWNELAAGHAPILSVFLTGWGWRAMDLDLPKDLGRFRDSFRVGYCEADAQVTINLRQNSQLSCEAKRSHD